MRSHSSNGTPSRTNKGGPSETGLAKWLRACTNARLQFRRFKNPFFSCCGRHHVPVQVYVSILWAHCTQDRSVCCPRSTEEALDACSNGSPATRLVMVAAGSFGFLHTELYYSASGGTIHSCRIPPQPHLLRVEVVVVASSMSKGPTCFKTTSDVEKKLFR